MWLWMWFGDIEDYLSLKLDMFINCIMFNCLINEIDEISANNPYMLHNAKLNTFVTAGGPLKNCPYCRFSASMGNSR